ncbi:TRAP transporter substrate-binding protein [Alkalihalobacillus sp. BA299]|uniref:TRAP transporter substrate-binding protein n=1 Tax=Alkalihalobacillus sp. BA299 TaxID=2815938 RepID=UPI001AD995FA|nr:TRAP transporter substrate-binding protein [Alkalihalobacillus sp. BA299]
MNNIFKVSCLFFLFLALVGCNSATNQTEEGNSGEEGITNQETYEISIGHVLDEGHSLHKTFEAFKEYVETESNEQITVDIFPNGQMGSDRELIEGVQVGTVTMAGPSTAPVTAFVPELSIFDLPFLFESREQAYEVLDSELGTELLNSIDQADFKGLGWWESGFRNLTNSQKPVETPEDLKGLKIRTMENEMHVAAWKQMGANPTPMAWGEVFVSLQQGALDGQENPLGIIHSQKVYEVQDYLTVTGHIYSPIAVLMNQDFYNSLPDDLKVIVDEGIKQATELNRQLVTEEDETKLKELKEVGMEVTELTSEQKSAFKEAALPIYDQYKEKIGPELVESILEAVN